MSRDSPSQESVYQSVLLPNHRSFWQNETQLYFVRFTVFLESEEKIQKFPSCKTIGTINDVKKQTMISKGQQVGLI